MIGRQGDLDEIGQEDQNDNPERGHDQPAGHQKSDPNEGRLQNRAADLVDDPCQHALIHDASFTHQRDDARKTLAREHDAGGAFGHVGGAGDGDADFGLSKGRRVVHAVAGHADDMSRRLKILDDLVFVFRVHLSETVDRVDLRGHVDECVNRDVRLRSRGNLAKPDLSRDFGRDRQRIAGQHLDGHVQAS